ncbi:hypothetical protein NECAME_11816 [Necator americanus]|uniref:Transmembrane protein 186 n=1 Tax=Necator americanus TaxID=51031 RepID=W2T3X9_NECAM|nr:hypothetical protein NECAME_11816 [Necator americanus]ETN76249.1 hypothetical protein NECAME_11816 [Necator americanus]
MLQRIGGTSIRRTHTQIERDNKLLQESLMNESWIAVYRYPGIRIAVLLARAKLLQTVASVLFLPYSSYQYAVGHVDITWFYSTAALAVFAPIALLVFSRYLNRLIGVIAMNESNDFISGSNGCPPPHRSVWEQKRLFDKVLMVWREQFPVSTDEECGIIRCEKGRALIW